MGRLVSLLRLESILQLLHDTILQALRGEDLHVRQFTTTLYPAAPNAQAIAAPSPLEAPVTSTTRPVVVAMSSPVSFQASRQFNLRDALQIIQTALNASDNVLGWFILN